MSVLSRPLQRSVLAFCTLTLLATPALAFTERDDTKHARHFDARPMSSDAVPLAAAGVQAAAISELRLSVPELAVEIDPVTGATRSLSSRVGYLTGPAPGGDVKDTALGFVRDNIDALGLGLADMAEFEITDDVPSAASGIRHLYLRQMHQGLPVYNGQLHLNIDRDGSILSLNNQFVPGLALAVNHTRPALDAQQAVVSAALQLQRVVGPISHTSRTASVRQITTLHAPQLSERPIEASLMLLPVAPGEVRLVWNFPLWLADGSDVADFNVDAHTGQVWTRISWAADADYDVFGVPVESPSHAQPPAPDDGRVRLSDPHLTLASPFGWHDTNGAAGAEYTITRGNNVYAYTDTSASDQPDPNGSPDCGVALNCTFVLDLTAQPGSYKAAAVANLFYMNNVIHDVAHAFGFDEVSGNFQVNNYGRGGLGGDAVNAEAQDGERMNNANFWTPPDGQQPRMQMFLWDETSPQRDGDFENGIITHEYGHGISNRLVGGPSDTSCLGNDQQPGEGLSDWWALYFTHPHDTSAAARVRGIGTYVLGQPPSGPGIRVERYDGNPEPNSNSWTYASIGSAAVPHGVGSHWAQAYWYATWALVDAHGYDPDLASFTGSVADAGNIRAMYYSIEGLKNTACSPSFINVRDGILQAAAAAEPYNGEDVCRLWQAFADFGLGVDASTSGPHSRTATNGFAIPTSCSFLGTPAPSQAICAGDVAQYQISLGAAFEAPVSLTVSDAPPGTIASFDPNPVTVVPGGSTLSIGDTAGLAAGSYGFAVHAAGAEALPLTLQVSTALPGVPVLLAPAVGEQDVSLMPSLSWMDAAQAESYNVEIATDEVFSNIVYSRVVEGNSHTVSTSLASSTRYYWRVRPLNACGAGDYAEVAQFTTQELICLSPNVAIPDNSAAGVASSVTLAGGHVLSDLDVAFRSNHTWTGDLVVTLTHEESDTAVTLLSRPGRGSSGYGCSGDNPDLVFDDGEPVRSAQNDCATGNSAYIPGASYQPFEALAGFEGLGLAGTWTLKVSDNASGDTGRLLEWCLRPTRVPLEPEIFKNGFENADSRD